MKGIFINQLTNQLKLIDYYDLEIVSVQHEFTHSQLQKPTKQKYVPSVCASENYFFLWVYRFSFFPTLAPKGHNFCLRG